MQIAKIFQSGRSQAVRLPKECRFDADEVFVARIDDMVILYPKNKGWDLLQRGIERFSDDFMPAREQPEHTDERKSL
jgi:antitoxin VapB